MQEHMDEPVRHFAARRRELSAEYEEEEVQEPAAAMSRDASVGEELGKELKAAFMRATSQMNLATASIVGESAESAEPIVSSRPVRPEVLLAQARRGLERQVQR